MSVCKERPATLPPLDTIGLVPVNCTHAMPRGGSGHRFPDAVPPSHQASVGLGFTPAPVSLAQCSNQPSTMQRTATQGNTGAPLQKRVRTKRGKNQNENNRVPGGSGEQGIGSGFNNNMNQMQNLHPVVPLQGSENLWDREAIQVDQASPELVEREVKDLLNKLTMKTFAPISDQIIAWANKSEKEKDGRTLIQVI